MRYVPRRHQQIAFDFCMAHEKAGLFMGMGLGKTVKLQQFTCFVTQITFTRAKKCVIMVKIKNGGPVNGTYYF